MECTTAGQLDSIPPPGLAAENWAAVLARLPADLETSAKQCHALQRRRGIRTAADLLRLALCYALADWSLRLVGAWAQLLGLGTLSDVAIYKRLRACRAWLGTVVAALLAERGIQLSRQPGIRLRIMDATVITQPGSQGVDWRVHLGIDLAQLSLDQVTLTDGHGAEGLGHFAFGPGDIVLADRYYGYARSWAHLLAAGAQAVVRAQWNTLPLRTAQGQRFDVIGWLQQAVGPQAHGPVETPVWLATPLGLQPLRLVARPLPDGPAAQARRRARANSRKNHRQPDARNVYAAGMVLLLTNLSPQTWDAAAVLQLYRWRWQIELYIKRLKSLLGIHRLRSRDPELAQTYLLTKLLAAILLDSVRSGSTQAVADLWPPTAAPVSRWRLDQTLLHLLTGWVVGPPPSLVQFSQQLPRLRRYLCGSPRKRPHQWADYRRWWAAGSQRPARTIC